MKRKMYIFALTMPLLLAGCTSINNKTTENSFYNEQNANQITHVKLTEDEQAEKKAFVEYIDSTSYEEGENYNKDIKKLINNNLNEKPSVKYALVSDYAIHYKPSKKQLNTFTQYILNDYSEGTYLDRLDEDKYMLTNIFKAIIVDRYYSREGEINPYSNFAFSFLKNTRDLYLGLQAVGDETTKYNEQKMEKALAEINKSK